MQQRHQQSKYLSKSRAGRDVSGVPLPSLCSQPLTAAFSLMCWQSSGSRPVAWSSFVKRRDLYEGLLAEHLLPIPHPLLSSPPKIN